MLTRPRSIRHAIYYFSFLYHYFTFALKYIRERGKNQAPAYSVSDKGSYDHSIHDFC